MLCRFTLIDLHLVFLFILMFTDKLSKRAYISILIFEKVEVEHPSKPQLQQIVIQALFTDTDQICRILQ